MKDLEFISRAEDGNYVKQAQELENVKKSGDSLTDFVVTKADLKSLALALAWELREVCLNDYDSASPTNAPDYVSFRLDRVLAYSPELKPEIEKKLHRGCLKTEEQEVRALRPWEPEALHRTKKQSNA